MNKILLITKREYLSRVKKKSFIIMTLIGPVLIALFYGLIFFFVLNPNIGSNQQKIGIYDMNDTLFSKLESDEKISYINLPVVQLKDSILDKNMDGLLIIPPVDSNYNLSVINLKFHKKPGLGVKNHIQKQIEDILTDAKLQKHGMITKKELEQYNSKIKINIQSEEKQSDQNGQEIAASIGMAGAFLIYIFIFLYGVQVMRGVIEEKTNRIVEVIISSVKPFQLMMGKIIGIALVGLTQFSVWLVFGIVTFVVGSRYISSENIQKVAHSRSQITVTQMPSDLNTIESSSASTMDTLTNVNFPLILGCFLFFFVTGYLFYGALFAAIGSAVDSETDTQQFMLPVTLPLIFGFIIASSSVVNDYNSSLATWLSIIPFTAPIVTMVRVPFMNEFNLEILASMVSMVLSFIIVVGLAGKIYRIGILMYGKKPSYKEIYKWLRYH